MCLSSNRTVDPNCRLCQLEVEDICHMVTRCPVFHSIRTLTINQLMNLVIDNSVELTPERMGEFSENHHLF